MSDDGERIRTHELINLHGQLIDEGEFERLGELLTDDVVCHVSALGGGQLLGVQAIADAGRGLGHANPLGHHVTNVVVLKIDSDRAWVRSKGLAVMSNGSTGSVVYGDQLRRTGQGCRIAIRRVFPRKAPLQRSETAPRDADRASKAAGRGQTGGIGGG